MFFSMLLLTIIHISYKFNSHIEVWHKFLSKYIGVSSFTINQHYLSHIGIYIEHLGPLRCISTRPLERMIGCIKRKIKSASKPAENVANGVLAHHQFWQNQWDDQPPQQCNKSPEHIPIADMVSVYYH